MNRITRIFVTIFAALVFVVPSFAGAVGSSTPQSVNVSLNVGESLTLTLSSTTLNLPPDGSASSPITATVAYNLFGNTTHPQGIAYAWYFSSPTALTDGSPTTIPSSNLKATLTGTDSGAATPCNNTSSAFIAGVPGAVCFASSFALPNSPSTGTLTDNFVLQYTGPAVPANIYSGTLNVIYYAP